MELTRVRWPAALIEVHDAHHRAPTPSARRTLAALSSLRARFSDDWATASASIAEAVELEPLDPLHQLRDALTALRFGDATGAIDRLDRLPGALADEPLVATLKALATLRTGEPRTARNIADRALQTDPKHAPARFLHAEAHLQTTKGGLEKLAELPRGPEHDALWADLLGKLAIVRPGDRKAFTQHLDRGAISKGSVAETIARTVSAWAGATADELIAAIETLPAGSRAEEVALVLLAARLGDESLRALRSFLERAPERAAIRRVYVAALTRHAVGEAAADRWTSALRTVEACLRLEPHEPIHWQNRAALFTLMGEHDAALDAWAEVDRHHYRLLLLGRLDADSITRTIRPHRMFAQNARLGARTGVFRVEEKREGAIVDRQLEVNQEAIDLDPDQLRSWIHHTRAELVLSHVALGSRVDRLLLGPPDPATAEARVEGLCTLAQSLPVLVPVEGKQLAELLAARFRGASGESRSRYAPVELDDDARVVARNHLEVLGDLAVLCMRWEPDAKSGRLVDELLELLRGCAPFFDERGLEAAVKDHRDGTTVSAVPFLDVVVRRMKDRDSVLASRGHGSAPEPDRRGSPRLRRDPRLVPGVLASNLRTSYVARRFTSNERTDRDEVEGLVELLDLARKDDPRSPRVEYWAARILFAGDLLDEARAAITAYHKVLEGDDPNAEHIHKLQELIEERRKQGAGRTRKAGPRAPIPTPDRGLTDIENELVELPTSMELYTRLCLGLATEGRWRDALAWSERALARCLSPSGQLRARELNLELLGLEALAGRDAGAAQTYLAGSRAGTAPALAAISSDGTPAALEYVRGLCLLAAGLRDDAQRAFRDALARATRGLHLAVLRPLAADVEVAILELARKEIDAALSEGRFRDAYAKIAEVAPTVTAPEAYLIDLARAQLAALLPTLGTGDAPEAPPPWRVAAAWKPRLDAVLRVPDARARTRQLAELAAELHEPSRRDAEALQKKLVELAEQLAIADALDRSTKLAAAGTFVEALAEIAEIGDRNPRVLRQRAIVLLRLERLDDADAVVARLATIAEPLAREFAARWPELRFRQRIAIANRLLRAKDVDGARRSLEALEPTTPEQQLEAAYTRAACHAADGYRRHELGASAEARTALHRALVEVEGVSTDARRLGHTRLLELREKLESDLALLDEGRA